MKHRNKILAVRLSGAIGAVLLSVMAGCDEPAQSSKPTTKPAVAVAASEPASTEATVAAYPLQPPSIMTIDGRDVTFPGAKLAVIKHRTGGYTLRLCSDDPPTAIDPGYIGNSYVLDMKLGIDRLNDLPAASWDFKSSESDDTSSGIYLHGYREQFHLDDVHASFQKNGDEMLTYITGTFMHTDASNPAAPPDRVQVTGVLRTSVPTE
jgi:hypothetical protein